VGDLTVVTDPRGKTWSTNYDLIHRKASAVDPLGHTTSWTYDNTGNLLTETRPDGGVITKTYDVMNRVATVTDPLNQIKSFTYNPEGRIASLTDAMGAVYSYVYDLCARQTKLIYPNGSHEDWTYDAVGNNITYATRAGQIKTCAYDNRNRLTGESWNRHFVNTIAIPSAVAVGYDAVSHVTSLANANSICNYSYDSAGELTTESQVQSVGSWSEMAPISYTYDADGNRASVNYPNGQDPSDDSVIYTYTARNQVASITYGNGGPLATYTYDLNGNRSSKILKNGTYVNYAYDDANRLIDLDNRKGMASFAKYDYTYNSLNDRRSRTESLNGGSAATDSYACDAVDQITNVSYSSGRNVSYAYDAVGNRNALTDGSSTTTYTLLDSLNEYTSVSNIGNFSYDNDGNLTQTGAATQYLYDSNGRMIMSQQVVSGGVGAFTNYLYDARNRRIVDDGPYNGNYLFRVNVYDGWNLVEEYDGNEVEQARYIYGPEPDELLYKVTDDNVIYYHQDALHSVVATTNDAGNVISHMGYDVYGAATIYNSSGATINGNEYGNRFLFTGREWLGCFLTSIYDYRYRNYSSQLGRFLQTDPIGFYSKDTNLYRYVKNSPTDYTDPKGLYGIGQPYWSAYGCGSQTGTMYICFVWGISHGDGNEGDLDGARNVAVDMMNQGCLCNNPSIFSQGCQNLRDAFEMHL